VTSSPPARTDRRAWSISSQPSDHASRAAAAGAAQQGLHPRQQLLPSERLADVVVRAAAQPAHLLQLAALRGQHQHGHVADLADPLERRPPVELGHRDVEDDQVGSAAEQLAQALASVLSLADVVPRPAEKLGHERAHVRIVVDDEDRSLAHTPFLPKLHHFPSAAVRA
jgi:hypothetical protein